MRNKRKEVRILRRIVLMATVLMFLIFKSFGKPILLRAENITVEIVAENLIVPWSIDFLPDGKILFTERVGRINVIDESIVTIAQLGAIKILL